MPRPSNFVFPEDIPSSVTEEECEKLCQLGVRRTVLEVGSWLGRSTISLAQSADQVHSVDWHKGDPHAGMASSLQPYFDNLARYGANNVTSHVGRAEDILPLLNSSIFDLIFIDGFHSYEQVKWDIRRSRRLLRKGGHYAFHDYGVTGSDQGGVEFGVTRAVDEEFGTCDDKVGTLALVYDLQGP